MFKLLKLFLFLLALSGMNAAVADAPGSMNAEQFESSLKYQSGKIALPGSLATLNLPANFRYLTPADTEEGTSP